MEIQRIVPTDKPIYHGQVRIFDPEQVELVFGPSQDGDYIGRAVVDGAVVLVQPGAES